MIGAKILPILVIKDNHMCEETVENLTNVEKKVIGCMPDGTLIFATLPDITKHFGGKYAIYNKIDNSCIGISCHEPEIIQSCAEAVAANDFNAHRPHPQIVIKSLDKAKAGDILPNSFEDNLIKSDIITSNNRPKSYILTCPKSPVYSNDDSNGLTYLRKLQLTDDEITEIKNSPLNDKKIKSLVNIIHESKHKSY